MAEPSISDVAFMAAYNAWQGCPLPVHADDAVRAMLAAAQAVRDATVKTRNVIGYQVTLTDGVPIVFAPEDVAVITDGDGDHRYLSTACLHDQHDQCRRTCKFCAASCVCQHHTEPEETTP